MSIITWPSALQVGPGSGFGQRRYDLSFQSDATGIGQDRVLAPPRWQLAIVQPGVLRAEEAGQWQSLLLSLRGRVNHLAAWNFGRATPRGTLRGTLTIGAQATLGATSLSIVGGTASATLLAGDMLQVGSGIGTSQLVMVTATATSSGGGAVTVTIEPPIRATIANGAAVTWDKPLAYFKLSGLSGSWSYAPSQSGPVMAGIALDLTEAWN